MKIEEIPEQIKKEQCPQCFNFSQKWGCPYAKLHTNSEGKCTWISYEKEHPPKRIK